MNNGYYAVVLDKKSCDDVQFMKGNFLLKDYQMDLLGKQQLFNFMYDFSHIAKMREEQEFVEPLE